MNLKERLVYLGRKEDKVLDWIGKRGENIRNLFLNIYTLSIHGFRRYVENSIKYREMWKKYQTLKAEYNQLEKKNVQIRLDSIIERKKVSELEEKLTEMKKELSDARRLISHLDYQIRKVKVERATHSREIILRGNSPYIVYLDRKNKITGVSPKMLKLMGYLVEDRNKIEGQEYDIFLADEKSRNKVEQAIARLPEILTQGQRDKIAEIYIESVNLARKSDKPITLDIKAVASIESGPIHKDKLYTDEIVLFFDIVGCRKRVKQLKLSVRETAEGVVRGIKKRFQKIKKLPEQIKPESSESLESK